MAMHPGAGAAPASSVPSNDEYDDFLWDDAAEAELQAIEAAYASASAKRRRLPDRTSPSPSPSPSPSSRPRYSQSPVSVGSTPPWALTPPSFEGNVRARHQPISFNGKIVYCRTPSEVEKAARDILGKIESIKAPGPVSLGFDLEWRPFPRRGEPPCKVAVMQLCMEKTLCYVLHIAHSGVPPILKSLLEDNSSIKVGICIDNDARKMLNDYDVCVQPLMDLSILANVKLAGPPKRWSLASLTEMITCKELPKPSNIRMGNWEAYVLTKQQLQYAATDAYISWYLYEALQSLPDYNAEAEIESVRVA
ncbi:Werner Syndrome-like exonuclease [Dichanthelium oligosanthes]|uniref:3'-5' exonuclease n=1 Tax=Dichanthelium oligosanthes TaxID=888268 RepID=A0A1E5VHT5_9POAL|nr:Werner Syndrome-like exonuclease [Dichanthelium oligosanthes]